MSFSKSITLLTLFAALLLVQSSCDKDGSKPFYLSCRINGEKWEALKYESLLSNRQVLAATVYHDPEYAWVKIGASRSVKTPSHPDSYMRGGMSINIIGFEGEGSYTLTKYPVSGLVGISYLLESWASMDISYAEPFPAGTYNASTTDEYTGVLTITKFDSKDLIIEGEFYFNALHHNDDVVVNVSDGQFRLEYEIKEIGWGNK
jgi:hypothetical protein